MIYLPLSTWTFTASLTCLLSLVMPSPASSLRLTQLLFLRSIVRSAH